MQYMNVYNVVAGSINNGMRYFPKNNITILNICSYDISKPSYRSMSSIALIIYLCIIFKS